MVIVYAPNDDWAFRDEGRRLAAEMFAGRRCRVVNPDAYVSGQRARADAVIVPRRFGRIVADYAADGDCQVIVPDAIVEAAPSPRKRGR